MNGNLVDVFNTYNVNILFTVAALPAKVSMVGPMLGQPPAAGGNNANLIMGGGNQPPLIMASQSQNTTVQGQPAQIQQKQIQEAPKTAKVFGDEDDPDSESQLLISAKEKRRSKGKEIKPDGKIHQVYPTSNTKN